MEDVDHKYHSTRIVYENTRIGLYADLIHKFDEDYTQIRKHIS